MTNTSIREILKKPPCLGYSSWTDCGTEYDCEYDKMEQCCSMCVCGEHGWIDPRTNEDFNSIKSIVKLLMGDT